jgi:enoyl-CoA hydratase/carnithine racemase
MSRQSRQRQSHGQDTENEASSVQNAGSAESAIRWQRHRDGVVILTMDDPAQRVNTFNEAFTWSLATVIDRLEAERDTIAGVILTSAKSTFFAGGDLNRLLAVAPAQRQAFLDDLNDRKSRLRRLETLGRPVVAVLAGAALGGGLELALTCHYRIAADTPRAVVGLPEVTLGLLPGGGGVVRVTRMLGPRLALPILLTGTRLGRADAVAAGLLDELAGDEPQAIARARAWIAAHPEAAQPWDRDDEAIRRGFADEVAAIATGAEAVTVEHGPAVRAITRLSLTGLGMPFHEALRAESAGLADLVVSDAAKATMRVVFFDTARIRSRLRSDAAAPARTPVLACHDARTRRLLEGRGFGAKVEVVDAEDGPGAVARLAPFRESAAHVVFDLLPPGPAPAVQLSDCGDLNAAWLSEDRLGDGGLVLEYRKGGNRLDDALSSLARAGVLPIALRPGKGSFTSAFAADPSLASQALCYPEDFAVASVRLGGRPAWLADATDTGAVGTAHGDQNR